jgi:predicted DNA binding CopG/RHH family protein
LPDLKPSLRTISLRLPEALVARLKVLANQREVPHQALLKVLLAERLKQEEATQVLTLRPAQGRL